MPFAASQLDAPPDLGPPWAAGRYQVQRNGTRYYTDPNPPCDLIADPHTDPTPGFTSLKPSKPFRKSVTVDGTKYTVPLECYSVGEWLFNHDGSTTLQDVDRAEFYKANNAQRDRNFSRGDAVHHAAEAFLLGNPTANNNPDAAPYLPPLLAWLEANVTDVHAIEAVVFGHGYGGTGDAWLNVRGTPCYVDWKSRGADSAHAIYEEEIGQGGAYTSARYCILPDTDRTAAVRAQVPWAESGLVLSIRPDGVEEFWYDLDIARQSFEQMHAAYRATSDAGKLARKAKVKPPAAVSPASTLTPAEQKAQLTTDPDEGGPADPAAVTILEDRYRSLDQAGNLFIRQLVGDAQRARVPFHLKDNHTLRRFEILRALVTLAEHQTEDDETVRCVLATIIGNTARHPNVTAGHLIGSLGADQAALFASRCDQLVNGTVPATVDTDGALALHFTN